jgi:hypothetical protein
MKTIKHGEVIDHSRWCDLHERFHGIYYACPSYPPDVLKEIVEGVKHFEEDLKTQDLDPFVRFIYERFFTGEL